MTDSLPPKGIVNPPESLGVDVSESASDYLGSRALAGNSFIEKKLWS